MKENTFTKAGLLIAGFISTPFVVLGAATLAQWTFEQTKPMNGGPLRPEVGEGSAIGRTTGMWTNPVGNGSGESWSSSQWTGGDHFEFMVNGGGNQFFDVTWSQISSSTGPRDFSLSYSLDGVNFVWLVDYVVQGNVTPNNWSFAVPLENCKYGVELQFDHPRSGPIYFRITSLSYVATNGGTLAMGGASRLDDFRIDAGLPASMTGPALATHTEHP